MSEIGNYKLTDAFKDSEPAPEKHKGSHPTPGPATTAEQTREANESAEAHNAEASIRDKMVQIGRGNQEAGRQGQ